MVELKLSFDDLPAIYNLSQKQSKENDDKYLPGLGKAFACNFASFMTDLPTEVAE